jgi:NAD(P)H dehydrogenase (quinone)
MKILLVLCILATLYVANAKKFFIVHMHQEPKSFCSALKDTAVRTLTEAGHEVKVSNLYEMKMFNRIDRTDFTELVDPTYFRPQVEQQSSNQKDRATFSKEIRDEMEKSLWADVIIFTYPYYHGYMPGLTQAWMERVFSYGFAFGTNGDKLKGKKGMLVFTTGGAEAYVGKAVNMMLFLIHDRIKFWKMEPLDPFPAFAAVTSSDEVRAKYLKDFAERLKNI